MWRTRGKRKEAAINRMAGENARLLMSEEDKQKHREMALASYNKRKGMGERWKEIEKGLLAERKASEGKRMTLSKEDVYGQTGSAHSSSASLQRGNGQR